MPHREDREDQPRLGEILAEQPTFAEVCAEALPPLREVEDEYRRMKAEITWARRKGAA